MMCRYTGNLGFSELILAHLLLKRWLPSDRLKFLVIHSLNPLHTRNETHQRHTWFGQCPPISQEKIGLV